MWAGVETDLIPTQPLGPATPGKQRDKRKDPKVWLAGELIVRCEHRGISTLPSQLFYKATLRRLLLNGNALTVIPRDIQLLKELRELRLGHNQLTALPDEICSLQWLEVLDLQHNQLESVPHGQCRLVHVRLLNLDGNPLSSRSRPDGPTLLEVWLGAAGQQQQQQLQQKRSCNAAKQAAAATQARLRQQTEAFLQHLMEQQDEATILAIKQAKLSQLQQASSQRITKLLCVADPDSLAMCLTIATQSGLGNELVAKIQQVQAATAAMQHALQHLQQEQHQHSEARPANGNSSPAAAYKALVSSDAHMQLTSTVRKFEELCKPGRPSGPVYNAAHAMWRNLQRASLERGWRCNSPSIAGTGPASPSTAAAAASSGNRWDANSTAGTSEHDTSNAELQGGSASPIRRFMTSQEQKRQHLQATGAKSYTEWCSTKQHEEHLQRMQALELTQREAKVKMQQVCNRAAKALDNSNRERAWRSKIVDGYPHNTFAMPPDELKAIRKAYQRAPKAVWTER